MTDDALNLDSNSKNSLFHQSDSSGNKLVESSEADQDDLGKHQKAWVHDVEFEAWVCSLPKIELHVHLDGSFDPFVLHQYLQSSKTTQYLPEYTIIPWDQSRYPIRKQVEDTLDYPLQFHSLCTCHNQQSLQAMIKSFEIFLPIVRGNFGLLEQLAFDFCKRQAEQKIIYTEVRYNPHLLAENGSFVKSNKPIDPRPVIDAITKGLRCGEKEFGITVNQILCCITWRPDWAEEIIDLAYEFRNNVPCAVVGVDIAAGEEHFDSIQHPDLYEPHYKAFQKAQELGLNITMHAGEVAGTKNIEIAVEKFGATRIGHGYRIVSHPDVMRRMKEKKIHFEVCPTSSVETGGWNYTHKNWKEHPGMTMRKHGLDVGLNSDDPAVFNTSLTWQLRIAYAKMAMKKDAIWETILKSVDATFLSIEEKMKLKDRMEAIKTNQEKNI